MFLERFSKIRKKVQTKIEKASLGQKTLNTNQKKKKLDNLSGKIKEKIEI